VEPFVLLAGGLVAGMLGGMLGIGGGVVLMPLLRFGIGLEPQDAAGTCVLAVFFTSVGGSYRHHRLGHLQLRPVWPVIVAGACAAVAASIAFTRVMACGHWLDLGIGFTFMLVAMRMAMDGARGLAGGQGRSVTAGSLDGMFVKKALVGTVGGTFPGLLGIGTGSFLVPAFTFFLRFPIKRAMAASLVCFAVTAAISACFKLAQGYVDLQIAMPACIGTVLGANFGALVNKRAPSPWLRLCCGVLFGVIAARFVLVFAGGPP